MSTRSKRTGTEPPSGDPSPPATANTEPMSEDEALSLPPADPIVALRIIGEDIELSLPRTEHRFTLGRARRPVVDLSLAGRPKVSRMHAIIVRRGNRIVISDHDSDNGTFFEEQREERAERKAGQSFRVGNVYLLAMDQHLQQLRPALSWVLGHDNHAAVDAALQTVATNAPLLLLGRAGCDQLMLADQIHRSSPRRDRRLVEIRPLDGSAELDAKRLRDDGAALLAHAARSTAYLDLAVVKRPTAPFVKRLFSTEKGIRPIVAAPTYEMAEEWFGEEHARSLRVIRIPSLNDRRNEIPVLMEALWVQRLSKHHVKESLGGDRVARLVGFDWRGNLDELRVTAERVHAWVEHGRNVRAAARALEMSHQSLGPYLRARIGPLDGEEQ